MELTEDDVLNALRDCYDPELPVNIVDLGLIYSVQLSPDERSTRAFPRQRVELQMTMTNHACPSQGVILEQVRNRLSGIQGIGETVINVVWEPVWTPHRISPAGRQRLGID